MKIVMPDSGLGDELCVTPSILELRKKRPNEIIKLEGFAHQEIWRHNPYLPGGSTDSGETIRLSHGINWDVRTLPRKFAGQFGVDLIEDLPQIFLTSEELSQEFRLRDWNRTVAIDVWASKPSRRWSFERFQAAADLLRAGGWTVVEVGRHTGPKLSGSVDLRDRLSVRQTAAALARCSMYVGNDSGLFHLAASVGTPQVILFSVAPASRRAYVSTFPIEPSTPCGGWATCADVCTAGPEPRCLSEIPPQAVAQAVEQWVISTRTSRS